MTEHRPVVLVVEDNPETSQVVALLLGVEGIKVVTAKDGLEGLEKCRAERPDLIVTDIMMPRLDGIEMIKTLRAGAECSGVPIVALTAYAQEMAAEIIEAGANGVLCKTEDFSLLLQMVRGLLYPQGSKPQLSGGPDS